ncbi:putative Late nodulin [Medicago truncatula]|uniref:Nodule Cysteine-Rich (NCR) secreted peptide n=1 Tax=Medicago truncatula TaxID=3880 RepID=G7I3U8_MEDTR|nr:Nodule Cysteine-Rich (NCR) secreted peptide [Medicago truncatula]RHN80305.1 putative Late nodulin [Medicago truncatula]
MAKTLKFVYAMILFIYIFLVIKNTEAYPPCETVADCPESYFRIYRCENNFCRYREAVRRLRPPLRKK